MVVFLILKDVLSLKNGSSHQKSLPKTLGAPTMAALTASAKMVQVVDGEPILNQRKDD